MYPELEGLPILGHRGNFERDSIEASSRDGVDAMLLESAVHCMEYVAQLEEAGLRFVFKGGTACQLLVGGGLQRLSIDIDIATDVTDDELARVLGQVKARMHGKVYAHTPVSVRGGEGGPLRMFNITAPTYYPAQVRETMVKLDVVLHEPAYALASTSLDAFYYASDIQVRTPTLSAMLGDKMSTLGPVTIGLRADRVIDNLKQFYDVGSMLTMEFAIKEARDAYTSCFREVSEWRGLEIAIDDAHEDLEGWCKVASALPYHPADGGSSGRWAEARRLAEGLEGFGGYIRRSNRLSKRRLRDIASRTALLSTLMRAGVTKGPLVDFIREPTRFQGAVVDGFQTILDGVSRMPREERWHIHIPEFKGSPLALAAWWGCSDPDGLAGLLM